MYDLHDVNEATYLTCGQDANPPHILRALFYVTNSFSSIFDIFIHPARLAPLLVVPSVQGRSSTGRAVVMFPRYQQSLQALLPTVHFNAFHDSLIYCFYPIAFSQESPFRFIKWKFCLFLIFFLPSQRTLTFVCSPEASPAHPSPRWLLLDSCTHHIAWSCWPLFIHIWH